MALASRELFSGPTNLPVTPRLNPRPMGGLRVARFTTNMGNALLPVGTPVAFNTSTLKWDVFTQGGSNGLATIYGFVYSEPIQLDDTDDVLGLIMVRGEVYEQDVNTAAIRAVLGGSASDANVVTALQAAAAGDRFVVRGIAAA